MSRVSRQSELERSTEAERSTNNVSGDSFTYSTMHWEL